VLPLFTGNYGCEWLIEMNPHHKRALFTIEKWFTRIFLAWAIFMVTLAGFIVFTTPALRDSLLPIFFAR